MTDTKSAVLSAADALVGAFSRHDRVAYFEAFAPEATFLFYNLDRTLADRAAYEAEWALWEERDGFRVLGCRSTDRRVQLVGEVAIFTHAVETDVSVGGETVTNNERETIVFARNNAGRWLAVHEHLSAAA
jgi:ketosteroid isomerase-like protein